MYDNFYNMKKVEHLLLVPIVILMFVALYVHDTTLDIHVHDTYFVLDLAWIAKMFMYWLAFVFVLYKVMRRRHKYVNRWWVISHIGFTLLIMAMLWYYVFLFGAPSNVERYYFPAANVPVLLEKWSFYNTIIIIILLTFLLIQLVFLAYFITRLFRSPVVQ
jgi:hypothetical protein